MGLVIWFLILCGKAASLTDREPALIYREMRGEKERGEEMRRDKRREEEMRAHLLQRARVVFFSCGISEWLDVFDMCVTARLCAIGAEAVCYPAQLCVCVCVCVCLHAHHTGQCALKVKLATAYQPALYTHTYRINTQWLHTQETHHTAPLLMLTHHTETPTLDTHTETHTQV